MKSLFKPQVNFQVNQIILRICGVVHLLFGLILMLFPATFLMSIGAEFSGAILIWQCVGVFYFVFSLGFFIASYDPDAHWLIVFLGLLVKLFLTFGFLASTLEHELSIKLALYLLITEVIWIIPFCTILESAYNHHTAEEDSPKNFYDLQNYVRTSEGKKIPLIAL